MSVLAWTGSTTPWLARGLLAQGLPVVVMDARRAADALNARPVKTDRADARALAEMLQTGWYTEVFVKSEESHRIKALLLSRDQLVKMKRQVYGQIRGVLRPFGIRLPARAGDGAVRHGGRAAVREDDVLYACIHSLLEAFGRSGGADRGLGQARPDARAALESLLASDLGTRRRPDHRARLRRRDRKSGPVLTIT